MSGDIAVARHARYQPGPTIAEVQSDRTLRRGHSGDGVLELQRALNAAGIQPPLVLDGLFGPKTEAALREVTARDGEAKSELDRSTWSSLQTPRVAPQYGTPPPPGSISAGQLARDHETQRRMTSGAPPGYHTMRGRIPPGVVTKAKSLLHHDYGTEIPFELDGKRYLARLERHYHPPGHAGPNGWHKGVTVYEGT
jgi:hypothetical protein